LEEYFGEKCSLNISEKGKIDIIASQTKGPPFQITMFDSAEEEILQLFLASTVKNALRHTSAAIIYRKRNRNSGTDLPRGVFEKYFRLCNNTEAWTHQFTKDGLTFFKNINSSKYSGAFHMFHMQIPCAFEKALKFFSDVNNITKYEPLIKSIKVLEPIGTNSHILYLRLKSLVPLQKKRDFVVLQSEMKYEDGILVSLGCSTDHQKAPDTGKTVRAQADIIGSVLQRVDSQHVKYTVMYQLDLEGKVFTEKLFGDNEWILSKLFSKITNIKKYLTEM